jgi:hypothetical protein
LTPCRPQLSKLESLLAEERGRGPMTIAQHSASARFFSLQGCTVFHGLHYLIHLSPIMQHEGQRLHQKGSTRLTMQLTSDLVRAFRPSAAQLFSSSYEAFNTCQTL